MTLKIFSIYDSKAEAYLNPFFQSSTGLAIRAFETAANTPDHQFNNFAGDFTLFEIGEWEDSVGTILMRDAYINLGTALNFIKEQD